MATRRSSLCLHLFTLLALASCSKTPAEPITASATADAGASAGFDAAGIARLAPPQHREKPPPPDDDATAPPAAKREPDVDLDATDSARDYVRRYIRATLRYGTAADCIDPQASAKAGDKITVRVADTVPAKCPAPSGVDETFVVDVGADRLTLPEPQAGRPALHPWPDDTMPDAPARSPVNEIADVSKWGTPLSTAFHDAKLPVIRVQLYGRGTYPIITLAGYPKWMTPKKPDAHLDSFARVACTATKGAPFAVFGGIDRSILLRVRCAAGGTTATPAGAGTVAWDTL